MWNLVFLFTGMFFILLLLCIFLSKEVVDSKENKIFKMIATFNLIGYISEISLQLSIRGIGPDNILSIILSKVYLVVIFIWFAIFSIYTFVIGLNKDNEEKYNKQFKTQKMINLVIGLIGSILLIALPIEIFYDGTKMYSYGMSVDILKILLGIYLLTWGGILISNIKKLKDKKFVPMFIVIGLLILNVILSAVDPGILISTMVGTFVCYTMFFTIENPDLKIVNELYKNKNITEQTYEDKSNLLYRISEDIKAPTRRIKEDSISIINTKSIKEKDLLANDINSKSTDILNSIDYVLNVSYLDKKNVKIIKSTYNIYNLYSQLVYMIKNELNSVDFKYSISDVIPKKLCGDSSKIKQIISSLCLYKTINNGVVDLDIYGITKYDVCRLVITIRNSSLNLDLVEINNILSSNLEIDDKVVKDYENIVVDIKLIKKLIDISDGTLLISSDDKGTVFKVIINQLVMDDGSTNILDEISKKISNKKRILLVDDDYDELNKYANELKKYNFDVVTIMYSGDVRERLSTDRFDLLLIDDEMISGNAVDLIKDIDGIKQKNLIKIVMLEKEKTTIKDHYINDYSFADYLLKNSYIPEIKRIANKYK